MTCRNAAWFGKRCAKPAKWTVRVNDDPDTDIQLCTVHARKAVDACHPTPVSTWNIIEKPAPRPNESS